MSESKAKILCGFYEALTVGNIEKMTSFCLKNAILEWGPYIFGGENEIGRWANELRRMFPKITLKETKLTISGNKIVHSFIILVTVPDGRRGVIPTVGEYDLKEGKIQHIRIKLSPGFILLTKEEVSRLKK